MVVKPKDLVGLKERQEIEKLEVEIDKKLKKMASIKEEETYLIALKDCLPEVVQEKLKEIYERAEWKNVSFEIERFGTIVILETKTGIIEEVIR